MSGGLRTRAFYGMEAGGADYGVSSLDPHAIESNTSSADIGVMPYESIITKLEETPTSWLREEHRDAEQTYHNEARRELANWGPEQAWDENPGNFSTTERSNNRLNLMYQGRPTRYVDDPSHPELFLADTEKEDAEIAMWEIPKHTAMRGLERAKMMPDSAIADFEPTITDTKAINMKRQTNNRFISSFKNFSSQDVASGIHNHTIMKVPKRQFVDQDESLRTYRPTDGLMMNYKSKGPEQGGRFNTQLERMAFCNTEGMTRGQKRELSKHMAMLGRTGQQELKAGLYATTEAGKTAFTPQDVSKVYRQIVNSQTFIGGGRLNPGRKSGYHGGSKTRGVAGYGEDETRASLHTEGDNNTGTVPRYSSGLPDGVENEYMVYGPDGVFVAGKAAGQAVPVSVTTKQVDSSTRTYLSNAVSMAKGLRGGFDPAKTQGKSGFSGILAPSLSDRKRIAKFVVPAAKNHGKSKFNADHSDAIHYGRTSFGEGGAKMRHAPKPREHMSKYVEYNQKRELDLQNAQSKSAPMSDPMVVSTMVEDSVSIEPIEGEQRLMSQQKKMGTKRLRAGEASFSDMAFDDNDITVNDFEDHVQGTCLKDDSMLIRLAGN